MTPEDMGATLARGEGVALWRQIAAALEEMIARGTLAPGERLPTEASLATQHGVNRHTARRALDSLAQRGLIRVEQGRGSFVAEDVVDYRLGPRTRFSELIRAQRREPEGRILWAREVPAEAAVAEALGLAPGAPVLAVERLGRPMAAPWCSAFTTSRCRASPPWRPRWRGGMAPSPGRWPIAAWPTTAAPGRG
ncbi:GntR family transcriptional regulator [Teichococcus aestuarii]|uniref:GntR family transcriptional regulator n=1 Tax=Teichococcus aestuarii TaxID=568898 RepID=UPI003608B860